LNKHAQHDHDHPPSHLPRARIVTEPRSAAERKADTLAKLSTPAVDVWVATTSGVSAHLVPVSLAWLDERVVIAVAATSRTARDLAASGMARLGLGPTRDVVLIDAVLEATHDVPAAPAAIAGGYAAQADWDPRTDTGYRYFVLRPVRVQAWREANELAGRTLMRAGSWLI
jgi:hypothetical protein